MVIKKSFDISTYYVLQNIKDENLFAVRWIGAPDEDITKADTYYTVEMIYCDHHKNLENYKILRCTEYIDRYELSDISYEKDIERELRKRIEQSIGNYGLGYKSIRDMFNKNNILYLLCDYEVPEDLEELYQKLK